MFMKSGEVVPVDTSSLTPGLPVGSIAWTVYNPVTQVFRRSFHLDNIDISSTDLHCRKKYKLYGIIIRRIAVSLASIYHVSSASSMQAY